MHWNFPLCAPPFPWGHDDPKPPHDWALRALMEACSQENEMNPTALPDARLGAAFEALMSDGHYDFEIQRINSWAQICSLEPERRAELLLAFCEARASALAERARASALRLNIPARALEHCLDFIQKPLERHNEERFSFLVSQLNACS